jgi:hypothetical protein
MVRVGRVVFGGALVLAAVALLFAVLDAPASALAEAAVWSPATLCGVALLLLFVSAGPRRVVVTAMVLLLAGCLGLVATHRLAGSLFWWLTFVGALALTGLLLAVSGMRGPEQAEQPSSPGAPVVRRSFGHSGTLRPVPDDASAIAVTAFFADVVLELPHAGVKAVELDASVFFGSICVQVPRTLRPEKVATHRAFLLAAGRLSTAPPASTAAGSMPPALSVVVVGVGGDVAVRHELDVEHPALGETSAEPVL